MQYSNVTSYHYYQVNLNLPSDQSYTYKSIQSSLILKRVVVSLGKRKIVGIVVASTEKIPDFKIKEIEEVLDENPCLSKTQFKFAEWISYYYLCSLGEAISLFVSFNKLILSKKKISKKKTEQNIEKNAKSEINGISLGLGEILTEQKISAIELTEEQISCYQVFNQNIQRQSDISSNLQKLHSQKPYLLHGITGSGKTYFYLKLIQDQIKQERQALILVPEIALTFQLFETCLSFFPNNRIAIYHSKITDKEKELIRQRVRDHEIDIIISTRSGLFLNYKQLGIVIVDEEHETSYKSETSPRYQVKRVTYYLTGILKIPLVFVSATPSVELYYLVKQKQVILLELKERFKNYQLSDNQILENPKHELILSEIQKKIFETVRQKKQVIIYINQRGFSSSVICGECEKSEECPNCDLSLTYHKKKNQLLCHCCGFTKPFEENCNHCGKREMKFVKLGTEHMDEFLRKRYLDFKVERLDSDTANNPNKIKKILSDFNEGKTHILVGTQMIIKGHDFKKVALVVVLDPEKYLLFPDYRSSERCYAHLIQVAGRAGRYDRTEGKSEMVIQTGHQDHYAIEFAKNQNYGAFYQKEIEFRKLHLYPPYVRLVRLVFRGSKLEQVMDFAEKTKQLLTTQFNDILILGPAPCMMERQRNYYRWNVVMKVKKMKVFLEKMQILKPELRHHQVYTEIDIDPISLY